MNKRNKTIYWIVTVFLSVAMLAGGIQQMLQVGGYNEIVTQLGYPLYLLSIIGVWKILGVMAILQQKFLLLKEWAYAEFFFAMSGAAISHIIMRHSFAEVLPSLILLLITISSWYFKPVHKGVMRRNTQLQLESNRL